MRPRSSSRYHDLCADHLVQISACTSYKLGCDGSAHIPRVAGLRKHDQRGRHAPQLEGATVSTCSPTCHVRQSNGTPSALPKRPGLQLGDPPQDILTRASAPQSGESLSEPESTHLHSLTPVLCDNACLCQVRMTASARLHVEREVYWMIKTCSFLVRRPPMSSEGPIALACALMLGLCALLSRSHRGARHVRHEAKRVRIPGELM